MNTDLVLWENIEFKIQNIKQPLAFFIKLIKINHFLDDWQMSLIIRYFFKHHFEMCMKYPLFRLVDKLENKRITRKILVDFYRLVKKKIDIVIILVKWKKAYNKNNFWSKDLGIQINHLHDLQKLFLSNYEIYKNTVPFHIKILCILKDNPNDVSAIKQLRDRLRTIVKLFGYKFFYEYEILLIHSYDFEILSDRKKIIYASYFMHKVNHALNSIINSFEIFNSVNTHLYNLLNPIPIEVETDIVSSETEFDDILFLIEN